ncbi:MAG: hypothetical protein GF320_21350 [Armatimonadia bacterium]|nr:hypothetical protein [Armatimonadia bacterium]
MAIDWLPKWPYYAGIALEGSGTQWDDSPTLPTQPDFIVPLLTDTVRGGKLLIPYDFAQNSPYNGPPATVDDFVQGQLRFRVPPENTTELETIMEWLFKHNDLADPPVFHKLPAISIWGLGENTMMQKVIRSAVCTSATIESAHTADESRWLTVTANVVAHDDNETVGAITWGGTEWDWAYQEPIAMDSAFQFLTGATGTDDYGEDITTVSLEIDKGIDTESLRRGDTIGDPRGFGVWSGRSSVGVQPGAVVTQSVVEAWFDSHWGAALRWGAGATPPLKITFGGASWQTSEKPTYDNDRQNHTTPFAAEGDLHASTHGALDLIQVEVAGTRVA